MIGCLNFYTSVLQNSSDIPCRKRLLVTSRIIIICFTYHKGLQNMVKRIFSNPDPRPWQRVRSSELQQTLKKSSSFRLKHTGYVLHVTIMLVRSTLRALIRFIIQGYSKFIVGVLTTCHLVLQMQPHVISFYGVTSRIRFMFFLFPQVSRNWRYESEPLLKPSPLKATNSLERTRLSC